MNKEIEDIELINLEEDDGQAENPYYPEFGDGEKEGDGEWEEDLYGEDLEDIIKEQEDYFDNEVVGKNTDEDLQTAYRNYSKDFNGLIELLGSIIEKGELTEEDKTALNTINTEYDDSYTIVKQEISNAQALALENQLSEIKGEMLTGSQEDVLNALTNGGMAQGIYLGEDGELYINAQFLQTRGLTVVNEDGQVTLSIDDDGNLTTSGDIVGGTITGAVMKAMRIDTEQVQIESPDGAMSISGALQQFKDNEENVRIKIGKDEDGEFKFVLYGENGQTILIDQNGIKQDALSTGIIKSEHIESNSVGTNHLQAGSITAESGIIGEGAIGDAQISSLDAGKLSAGKVDTSKVEVSGANNHLKIKGNRLQVFQGVGSNAKERVSLGDVNGDGTIYGLRVRGADGQTILLDENGVTSEGLTDGSITNNKISEDANIDGAKLNINSVINKINEDGTETINGTKIEVEGTTLSAKLSSIINQQNEDGQKISQAQSQISANTNAIGLKVDSQTYQQDKTNMTKKMEKNTADIGVLKNQITLKVEQSDIQTALSGVDGKIDSKINTAKSEIKATTDGITSKVETLEKKQNSVDGKVTTLETWKSTAEQKITDSAIINTIKTSKNADGKNTFTQQSDIEQLNNSWTAKFKDGYNEGITSINKNGITVTASNVKSKTSMSADGFKITKTDTNEDVLKVNADGKLVMKGDIQGSTFSSTSGAFKVLDDGTVDASTLSVDEEISTDTLTVQHINNSKYQQVLDMNVSINISSTSQNSAVFEDGATYKSINDFLDACPRNLNGYSITLNLLTDINENIVIDGLNSGTLIINFNGKTVYGYIFLTGEHMRYRLYGNKNGSTGGTTVGSVMPNTGNSQTGGYYSIVIHSTWAFVYDLKVYGGKASGNNIGIRVANWANAYLSGVQFINCYNGLRAYNLGRAYLSSSSGTTSNYAFASYHSGEIILNASNQAGRSGSTNHTYVANNSTIISTGVTFSSTAVAGSNTNTSTNKVSKTVTINSTLGDTYRTTVYNSWKKDSSVRQGQWSTNGINNGCWFYGSQFEEYKSKEIEKVSITIKRQAGGSSSAVKHTLKMHNHATRPTGKPTFATGFSKDFDLAVNDSITINLTSTEDINAFKQNKGFGLVAKSGTQTYYSVCSGSASVKITYKE